MAGPPKKKQIREEKTNTETIVAAAVNSPYNTFTPLYDAKNIRVSDPITRRDAVFATNSDALVACFAQLCSIGMKEKLINELDFFSKTINPAWSDVRDRLLQGLEIKD